MMTAIGQLLGDFLSTIIFLIAYALSGRLAVAAAIAIAVGIAQFLGLKLKRRTPDAMQWMSLGFVVALGSVTLLTENPRFILLKPGFVHLAIAAVMLRRGWMIRYLPRIVCEILPENVIVAAGYGWAALMAAIGLAILVLATFFDLRVWAWFVTAGVAGLQIGAFLLQYAVFRAMITRLRRAPSPPS